MINAIIKAKNDHIEKEKEKLDLQKFGKEWIEKKAEHQSVEDEEDEEDEMEEEDDTDEYNPIDTDDNFFKRVMRDYQRGAYKKCYQRGAHKENNWEPFIWKE